MCFHYVYIVTYVTCGHKEKWKNDRLVPCEEYARAGLGYREYHAVEVPDDSFGGEPFCFACQTEIERLRQLAEAREAEGL